MGNINPESYFDLFGNGEPLHLPYVYLDNKFVWFIVGGSYAILIIILLLILIICKIRKIRPIYKNPTAMIYLVSVTLFFILIPICLPWLVKKNSQAHLLETVRSIATCSRLRIFNSPAMVKYLCNHSGMRSYLTNEEKEEAKFILMEFITEDKNAIHNFAQYLCQSSFVRVLSLKSDLDSSFDANMFTIVEKDDGGKYLYLFEVMKDGNYIFFDKYEQYRYFYLNGIIQNMNSHPIAVRLRCATIMRHFSTAIDYMDERYGCFPDPNRWCDQTIKFVTPFLSETVSDCVRESLAQNEYPTNPECKGYVPGSMIICQCKYAMNPNCTPYSPPDTVLLFESLPGWNRFGGPEILEANHHQPPGCNILFQDGSVRFIKKEDLSTLRWE